MNSSAAVGVGQAHVTKVFGWACRGWGLVTGGERFDEVQDELTVRRVRGLGRCDDFFQGFLRNFTHGPGDLFTLGFEAHPQFDGFPDQLIAGLTRTIGARIQRTNVCGGKTNSERDELGHGGWLSVGK